MTAIRLHIGGRTKTSGWTTFDTRPGAEVDYTGAYHDLSRFPSGSIAAIYACHVLQRLSYQGEVKATLGEWFRALSPGGELILSVPDLRILSWQFLREDFDLPTRFHVMRMMFGGHSDPADFSVTGFVFESIQAFLQEAGFQAIRRVGELGIFTDASALTFGNLPVSLNVRAHKPPAPTGLEIDSIAEFSGASMQRDVQASMVLRNVARLAPCRTIVDLGCADGHFSLSNFQLFQRPVIVNVDANPLYEPSLKAISEALQGHYRIAAVADRDGEIEITEGAHSYWDSVRPLSDDYWKSINHLSGKTRRVRSITLDSLAKELSLPAPYLLKLDLQGAEEMALKGGREFLRATNIVICEAQVCDFANIHSILDDADFTLFEIMSVYRSSEGQLSYFYPIYLPRGHAAFDEQALWKMQDNARAIQLQVQRRQQVLKLNETLLNQHRKAPETPERTL